MTPFSFFYDSLLHLIAIPTLCKIAIQRVTQGKYKRNFSARFGYHFPEVHAKGKPIVWIHAVSVGEVKAILPLADFMRAQGKHILLTCVTETGYAEAKKGLSQEDTLAYLPFDLPYVIKPIVRRVKPSLVIITETDFWFHFQQTAKECGATLVLVNGKISLRSLKRFHTFSYFAKNLLHCFDLLCVQNSLYARRFQTLGVRSSKLVITGNLKLDNLHLSENVNSMKEPVLTIGSTHDPEEKMWIPLLKRLWAKYPQLKVYLVPRHPERFDAVARLLEGESVHYTRWSVKESFDQETRLILVDRMGALNDCYARSTVAFVGGSLIKRVGGHNLLEPLQYNVPVIYGTHIHNQTQFDELVLLYGAGQKTALSQLENTVQTLLDNEEKRAEMAQRGCCLIKDSKGALEKTLKELNKITTSVKL